MIDLDQVDKALLLARGKYSTVRALHEDQKKALSIESGKLQSIASQVLKRMQPDNDEVPESVSDLLLKGRAHIDEMERIVADIESLAALRNELKREAW